MLKIEEPLNLDVNVTQMMKTLAIQTTADYGTIDLSVNIPVKDLPTFLSVLSDGWENVRIRDVNKYVDELAGENFAEVASISVAETVTLLNLIKAKHTVMSEKLNMFAAFFMSCVVFWLGFAFFASVEKTDCQHRLFLLLRHHLEHGWFWRFRSSKHETNRVLVCMGYIGLWYFRHHDRFFLQYRQCGTRRARCEKLYRKPFVTKTSYARRKYR